MLTLLKIRNIALIDELSIEFGSGLNLLTGETGSGKSIIVDSLGALTGDRISTDLIKSGRDSAVIEGLFAVHITPHFAELLDESGIEIDGGPDADIVVRREISSAGKNRIFINGQLATQALLKRVGRYLVDIHGQGEQASLYNVDTHIQMLDRFAGTEKQLGAVFQAYTSLCEVKAELNALVKDEADKLQLVDILKFQISEIAAAGLAPGEDTSLEEEKLRLNNVEKLTALSSEAMALLYDNEESTASTLERAARKVDELAAFDQRFADYTDGIQTAKAVIEDLAFAIRDLATHIDFSPERLDEIENRLAEITRLKRKYGESIEAVLEHLAVSEDRLNNIETAELREQELRQKLNVAKDRYVAAATELHRARSTAAKKFEKAVEEDLKAIALDKARFEVRIEAADDEASFTASGFDKVEFYFSANPGEATRPLAKVASGGEASRLMLTLKTAGQTESGEKTAVFDEIDVGIGGRVAEAVGRRLKALAASQQVLCVTHQPQIASLADSHFIVEKAVLSGETLVSARELDRSERVEEIARMLAGEHITEAARENARSMLAGVE